MQALIHVIEQGALFAIVIGGTLSAFFIALTGIQYATSGGDPQRVSQARSSFFAVLVGLMVLGMALVIPRILNEVLVEPVGGVGLRTSYSYGDCDEILQAQLVFQRGAYDYQGMRAVVRQVQTRFDDICYPEIWNPQVDDDAIGWSPSYSECFILPSSGPPTIEGIILPSNFLDGKGTSVQKSPKRDLRNNILVYFEPGPGFGQPFNEQNCWVYFSGLDAWYFGDNS